MSTLKQEMGLVKGYAKRRFLLLRIANIDANTARGLVGASKALYNNWFRDQNFIEVHRRREELSLSFYPEAVKMIRRETQMAAVIMEARIIERMKEELETQEYKLIRTGLAREVYAKLIGDLDVAQQAPLLSWEERVQNIFINNQRNPEGELDSSIEGEVINTEGGEITDAKQLEAVGCKKE